MNTTVGRKRLRKGTVSCTEFRGSQCIDQHLERATNAEDERITLRERVTRLESLLKEAVKSIPTADDNKPSAPSSLATNESQDIEDLAANADRRAPFVSVLENSELEWVEKLGDKMVEPHALQSPTGSTRPPVIESPTLLGNCSSMADMSISDPTVFRDQKAKEVCMTLRSALPNFDLMMLNLMKNGSWWSSFGYKIKDSTQTPMKPLDEFAKQAYISNNPAELGTLVTAYARSAGENYHLYGLVDRLVISDSVYISTLEGLECLILLAKTYTDIGQPRRSWLAYRRGLAIAQLMGLYRKNSSSQHGEKLWWSVYHGDRFTSMLLGLPYGVNDAHYGPIMDLDPARPGILMQKFHLQCALIAGKIIDRNLSLNKPSFAGTVQLDEQLDTIAMSMTQEWWDMPIVATGTGIELDQLRDRLLQQFSYFHVKIYLHLPFLVQNSPMSLYDHSKLVCIESSRQILKRIIFLRGGDGHQCLFECKTIDFMAFMAAVVLLVGLTTSNSTSNRQPSGEDLHFIKAVAEIFDRERQNGCNVSSQCYSALVMLSGMEAGDSAKSSGLRQQDRIVIPYFGIVVRNVLRPISRSDLSKSQKGGESNGPSIRSPTRTSSSRLEEGGMQDISPGNQGFGYNEQLPQTPQLGSFQLEVDHFGNLLDADFSGWLNTAMMDIDQDWNLGDWADAYTKAKALVSQLTNEKKVSLTTRSSVSSVNWTALEVVDATQGPQGKIYQTVQTEFMNKH
ncbi:hypothetical protein G7Y89_g14057 [Cudoniella acicularis]|uniref:Xylanolytic transcriptional activator regulatory domain-containing protein n=1 Tax=Cudoniella acicularis TaxID=354080 RepID=A0A8H4VVF0_9HELO|nr:hypothetical protein G7Y89_g14057 [Cudoniella acicularis]